MAGTVDFEDPPPRDRVVMELAALKSKLQALDAFIGQGCPGAGPYHRTLLVVQAGHMRNYVAVLEARLLNWDE